MHLSLCSETENTWEILNACINILFYVYKINYFLRITVDWTDTYRKYK